MNWILEAYSNVYNTAMLQDRASCFDTATAKGRSSRLAKVFGRKAG